MNKVKIFFSILILVLIVGIGIGIWQLKQHKVPTVKNNEFQQYMTFKDTDLNQAELKLYNQTKETLAKDPTNKDALIDLANLYIYTEVYDKAEEILKKIGGIYKDDTIVLQNLATVYHDTKRYKEAEQTYNKILESNILWMPALESLSQLYRFKLVENNLEFPKLVEKARVADYQDQYEGDLLKILGFYYDYQGDNKKSIEYFNQYLEKFPNDESIKGVVSELK